MPPLAPSRSSGWWPPMAFRLRPKAPRFRHGWISRSGSQRRPRDKSRDEPLGRGRSSHPMAHVTATLRPRRSAPKRAAVNPPSHARKRMPIHCCLPRPLVTWPVARHDGERPRAASPVIDHSPEGATTARARRRVRGVEPEGPTWPGSSSLGEGTTIRPDSVVVVEEGERGEPKLSTGPKPACSP